MNQIKFLLFIFLLIAPQGNCSDTVFITIEGRNIAIKQKLLNIELNLNKEIGNKTSLSCTISDYVVLKNFAEGKIGFTELFKYQKYDEKYWKDSNKKKYAQALKYIFSKKLIIKKIINYENVEIVVVEYEDNGVKQTMGSFNLKNNEGYYIVSHYTLIDEMAGNFSLVAYDLKKLKALYDLKKEKEIFKPESVKKKENETVPGVGNKKN